MAVAPQTSPEEEHNKTLDKDSNARPKWYTLMTQNGQPFHKGLLPPFIEQGGEGVTMWDRYSPLTLLCTFPTRMCACCTSPTRPLRGRKSLRHPPPPNPHIHRNVPRRGVACEIFRRRVSTGSSTDWSPDFRAGRHLQVPNRHLSGRPPLLFTLASS